MLFDTLETFFNQIRGTGRVGTNLVMLATVYGLIALTYHVIKCALYSVRFFKFYFIYQMSSCCQIDFSKQYGKWAVVTGATDGIGLATARELARRGMSVIIIARNEEKLAAAKGSLEQEQCAGEIVTIKFDFSLNSSLQDYSRLQRQIDAENREIGVLFNNVATCTVPTRYHTAEMSDLKQIIDVNMLSAAMLSRIVLPAMLARDRGLVVNISSMGGRMVVPYELVYGPGKAFINQLSKQLQFEYRKVPNIKIVNLEPAAVMTNLLKNISDETVSQVNGFLVQPDEYAKSVMNILSKRGHPLEFCGIRIHEIFKQILGKFEAFRLSALLIEFTSLKTQGIK